MQDFLGSPTRDLARLRSGPAAPAHLWRPRRPRLKTLAQEPVGCFSREPFALAGACRSHEGVLRSRGPQTLTVIFSKQRHPVGWIAPTFPRTSLRGLPRVWPFVAQLGTCTWSPLVPCAISTPTPAAPLDGVSVRHFTEERGRESSWDEEGATKPEITKPEYATWTVELAPQELTDHKTLTSVGGAHGAYYTLADAGPGTSPEWPGSARPPVAAPEAQTQNSCPGASGLLLPGALRLGWCLQEP
ncbi:uncharacterized protein LOC141576105 [Camelus bactrianus]|uniref:Uncharacterized protein LOC141576105 n=1 Tax=Camelus bactrianus TaxID=9837 RepID=A0AC58PXD1_CAMBA